MENLLKIFRNRTHFRSYEILKKQQLTTFINPVSYLLARKTPETYSRFQYILADGWLFVAALRCIGIKAKRYSFDMTSLAPVAFEKAVEEEKSIFFIGSKPEEIKQFIRIIKSNFPKLKIADFRSGYFVSKEERDNAIHQIVTLNPDIVVAGLGVPLQEKFLVDLVEAGWNGCGYTCGGFIHQTSGGLYYYPEWVNKFHLRMPYRFIKEPHFRKRIPDYFKFIFLFTLDYLQFQRK